MRTQLSRSLLAGLVSVAFAAPASAAIVVNFVETGAGVFGSFSGSVSLSGLTFEESLPAPPNAFISPAAGNFSIEGSVSAYVGSFTSAAFGPGGFALATAFTGDLFGIGNNTSSTGGGRIFVPLGYSAGDPLTGTMDFSGSSLATLGMTPGSYVTALPGGDSFTINVTPVPEPGAYALMLAGLGVLGFVARRRRGQAVAA